MLQSKITILRVPLLLHAVTQLLGKGGLRSNSHGSSAWLLRNVAHEATACYLQLHSKVTITAYKHLLVHYGNLREPTSS